MHIEVAMRKARPRHAYGLAEITHAGP